MLRSFRSIKCGNIVVCSCVSILAFYLKNVNKFEAQKINSLSVGKNVMCNATAGVGIFVQNCMQLWNAPCDCSNCHILISSEFLIFL